jgi:signal transduction histidine kinase
MLAPVSSDDGTLKELPSISTDASRFQTFSRLVESLMHEVRNPLNALSINLEVLTERLKSANNGQDLPANQEKHLTAIRNQLQRVDGTMRAFAEFLCPTTDAVGPIDFSAAISRAMELLAHETRRGRVTFQSTVGPEIHVKLRRSGLVPFLALEPLMQSIFRSAPGSVVEVSWARGEGKGMFEVRDTSAQTSTGLPLQGLKQACDLEGLQFVAGAGSFSLSIPLWEYPS